MNFSVIIPARDEERYIGRCIDSVKAAAASRDVEIIVVLNRCTDNTEQIALQHGAKVIREDAKNLAIIRNRGVRASTGKVVVTIDADSRMSRNMFDVIEEKLNSDRYIGGGVLILPERWSLGILLTGIMLLPIALRHRIAGGLFFCLRETFEAIGGFNEQLASVEDIDFAKRLREYGRQVGKRFAVVIKAHILTSCRKFDHFGDWYFVTHPRVFKKLLEGHHQELADKVWYDFPRKG